MARRIPTFIEYKAAMSKQLGQDLSSLPDERVWESYIRVYPEAAGGAIKEEEPVRLRPAHEDHDKEALIDYLKKQKRSERGNTQGCGCIVSVIGLALCVIFPPLGIFMAAVGIVVLIYGLIR